MSHLLCVKFMVWKNCSLTAIHFGGALDWRERGGSGGAAAPGRPPRSKLFACPTAPPSPTVAWSVLKHNRHCAGAAPILVQVHSLHGGGGTAGAAGRSVMLGNGTDPHRPWPQPRCRRRHRRRLCFPAQAAARLPEPLALHLLLLLMDGNRVRVTTQEPPGSLASGRLVWMDGGGGLSLFLPLQVQE